MNPRSRAIVRVMHRVESKLSVGGHRFVDAVAAVQARIRARFSIAIEVRQYPIELFVPAFLELFCHLLRCCSRQAMSDFKMVPVVVQSHDAPDQLVCGFRNLPEFFASCHGEH